MTSTSLQYLILALLITLYSTPTEQNVAPDSNQNGQQNADPNVVQVDTKVEFRTDHVHVHDGGLDDWDEDDWDEEDDEAWEPDNVIMRDQFVQNKEHIEAHFHGQGHVFDVVEMAPGQMDFHFFTEHDTDKDGFLDGLELLHSIIEGLDEKFDFLDEMTDTAAAEKKAHMLKTKAWLSVDRILRESDTDNDGYLSWTEFKSSRTVAANNAYFSQQQKRPEDTRNNQV